MNIRSNALKDASVISKDLELEHHYETKYSYSLVVRSYFIYLKIAVS